MGDSCMDDGRKLSALWTVQTLTVSTVSAAGEPLLWVVSL